jgi:hypothetical protein
VKGFTGANFSNRRDEKCQNDTILSGWNGCSFGFIKDQDEAAKHAPLGRTLDQHANFIGVAGAQVKLSALSSAIASGGKELARDLKQSTIEQTQRLNSS